MDTDYDERRTVVAAFALALVDGLLGEPPVLSGEFVLGLQNTTQELNVSTAKEVVATVHVDDALARLGSCSFEQLPEGALFLLGVLGPGLERRRPEPHINARGLGRLVGGVEPDALHHLLA